MLCLPFGHQGDFGLVSSGFKNCRGDHGVIEVVFANFFQLDGFRAERLGDAMRVLGMSPTEDQDRPPAAMF